MKESCLRRLCYEYTTDHRPVEDRAREHVRTYVLHSVDLQGPWDCYQGPLSPLLMTGYGISVIGSKLIYLLRRRRDSYVISMVICGTEGEC